MALAALIVAAVTGTLAVLNFGWTIGWSVWQHRRTTRPNVTVSGSFAVLGTIPEPTNVFEIRAINDGLVPVNLNLSSAQMKGVEDQLIPLNYYSQAPLPIPRLLAPGDHWQGLVEADKFRKGLASLPGAGDPPWKIRVGVKDVGQRFYYSDWFEVRG